MSMRPHRTLVCRHCGMVLALSADSDGKGFFVNSPTDCQQKIYIVPQGRTWLKCPRCGGMREWHPPRRKGVEREIEQDTIALKNSEDEGSQERKE